MGLLSRLVDWFTPEERGVTYSPLSWNAYQGMFSFDGSWYPYGGYQTTYPGQRQEEPEASFPGYAGLFRSNPVVFACMETRRLLFSEARFQYRRLRSGRPGELFGTPALAILEQPWPGGTTGDLLSRAMQDIDLAGNFYCARRGNRLMRLRPDWVSIVLGSNLDPDDPAIALDATVIGYLYHPGGYASTNEPVTLLPEEVAHWAPTLDPLARFRGMSWLTSVIREVMGDAAASEHKLKFYENNAMVNSVVIFPPDLTQEQFNEHVATFKKGQEGVANAYRTLFLGAGADYKAVGSDMVQNDFKVVQGAGETRIAAAARVPPIMVGLSEGLAAATYSNYGQARRAFADLTMRPLWRDFAGSMASIVDVPPDAQLWYDDRDISFLQEDQKDAADIQQTRANSTRTLLDAGFTADSVKAAIIADDFALLEHSGLFSVQLQPPGSEAPDAAKEPSPNGAVPIGAVDE